MSPINYSFIIPHKDSPQYLNRLLNTIPRRDDIEIIVVDDGSNPAIVDWNFFKFDNDRCVSKILSPKNGGGGYARNLGIKEARGKWLLFPDADDYYSDDFIETLDKYVESDYDVVYFSFKVINEEGGHESSKIEDYNKDAANGLISPDWVKYKIYAPWCKMVNHDFIRKYDIRFEEVSFANDRFFTFQLGYFASNIHIETSKLYYYIYYKKSVTNSNWDFHKAYVRINNWIKLNPFYELIGHPEWKNTFYSYLRDIKNTPGIKRKLSLIIAWFWYFNKLQKNKMQYVEALDRMSVRTH